MVNLKTLVARLPENVDQAVDMLFSFEFAPTAPRVKLDLVNNPKSWFDIEDRVHNEDSLDELSSLAYSKQLSNEVYHSFFEQLGADPSRLRIRK